MVASVLTPIVIILPLSDRYRTKGRKRVCIVYGPAANLA